uniref:Activin_recp domain-containing protein n=1 Tax=Rhabditophanes sp. KR3021 TaxID=114890 RepID=A0AC35U473_9BILA
MIFFKLNIIFLFFFVFVAFGQDVNSNKHIDEQATIHLNHQNHDGSPDPNFGINYKEPKKIRCYECHSESSGNWYSTCTKKRFCMGLWCVAGPDGSGTFRGCMDVLPFLQHESKCIDYKDEDGIIKRNCYCNEEYCNSSAKQSLNLSIMTLLFFSAYLII